MIFDKLFRKKTPSEFTSVDFMSEDIWTVSWKVRDEYTYKTINQSFTSKELASEFKNRLISASRFLQNTFDINATIKKQ